ncbi:hypothetical protein [Saccharothrix longispora]|uniref:hypothetical protein n=1 Tax=Saccharothrix longispora TaxID=33920 RepID=UPI0028FD5ACC|nr:hypothetical protein [Saccharothrix longispora]MBY8849000.1 hypothetical protein [Saccharothrix sp. MB29]MDU0293909.1 hypothetical protein [Saccharothrix longispora]
MPKGFYTDDRGRVRPVAGGGGKGGLLLAGLVALSAVGYGGAVGLSAGPGEASGAGGSGLGLAARKAEGADLARRGDAEGAWLRMGLRAHAQSPREGADCVAASFGGVREFLQRTRCVSMDRVLFTVGDDAGNTMVVSVAWVEFASRADAREFRALLDEPGSGDISPLPGTLVGLGDVAFTGANYGAERERGTVTVAEAEPVSGFVTAEVLDAVAEVAALLPR